MSRWVGKTPSQRAARRKPGFAGHLPADPDRDPRALHRGRPKRRRVDRVLGALVIDRLPRPERGQQLRAPRRAGRRGGPDRGPRRTARTRARPPTPSPAPKTSRPPLSRSSDAVSRATFHGRRRASGVTSAPIRIRSVDARRRRRERDPRVGDRRIAAGR